MPGASLLFDSLIALAAFVCSVAFTLTWLFRSSQTRVAKTPDTARFVVKRLAIVIAVLFVVCRLADIAVWFAISALGLCVLGVTFLGVVMVPMYQWATTAAQGLF